MNRWNVHRPIIGGSPSRRWPRSPLAHNMSILAPPHDGAARQPDGGAAAPPRLPDDREPTPAELMAVARAKLVDGDLAAARPLLDRLVAQDATNASGLADDALFLLGHVENAGASSHAVDDAYGKWLRILKEFPAADRAPDAALCIMKALRAVRQREKANALQALLIRHYPVDIDVKACIGVIEAGPTPPTTAGQGSAAR